MEGKLHVNSSTRNLLHAYRLTFEIYEILKKNSILAKYKQQILAKCIMVK